MAPSTATPSLVHTGTAYWNVWWRLAIIGTGFALTMSPLTGAAIHAVSRQESGLASGISRTTRQIGAVGSPPTTFESLADRLLLCTGETVPRTPRTPPQSTTDR